MGQRPATIITLTVLLLGVPVIALAQTPTSLTLNPATITGGQSSTGQVSLSGPAPTGGLAVALVSSNKAAATVPPSVTVAAGAVTASLKVATVPVAQSATVTITAAAGGGSKTAQLHVLPPVPSSVTLAPSTVAGGTVVTGQVSPSGPAPASGFAVNLSSSNPDVATVKPSITVEAGATTASFKVATVKVGQLTAVNIATSAGGVTKTAQLTVTP